MNFCLKKNIPIQKPLCLTCLENIKPIISLSDNTNTKSKLRCKRCGGILKDNMCICGERKFFFKESFFVWPYYKEARRILKQAKFKNRSASIRYIKNNTPLALWKFLEGYKNAVLLPMPSSHNFIFKISKFLANDSGLPLYKVFYKKQKKLQSKLLHQKDRFLEIEKNMFLNKKKFEKLKISSQAKKYILIDDIWTSGATMNYASKLIYEYGIPQENIFIIALFRRDRINRI